MNDPRANALAAPPAVDATRRGALHAALVGAFVTVYLIALGLEPPIHTDTARDMLLARDGLASGIYRGCHAAFGGFVQGALWERYLAATHALGLGPNAQYALLLALLGASVVAFHHETRASFGPASALAATLAYLPLMVVAMGYPNLWNPALAPVGATLWWACALRLARDGGTLAAAGVGFGLALATEAHMASVLLAPVALALAWVAGRRPVHAVLAASVSGVGPSLAFSFESWKDNYAALGGAVWYLPFLAAASLLALAPAARGRARFLALGLAPRLRALLSLVLGVFTLEVVAASVFTGRALVSPQYAIAVLPALCTVLGLAAGGSRETPPGRARRVAMGLVLFVLLVLPLAAATVWRVGMVGGAAGMPVYGMRDARTLALHFWSRGYTFPDLQRHLRGPDALELMTSIAPYAKSPRSTPDRAMPDLRVLAFDAEHAPRMALPEGAERVPLGRGREAWILPIEPWVALAPSRFCVTTRDGAPRELCVDVGTSSIRYSDEYRMLAYPQFEGARPVFERAARAPDGTARLRWELPITLRGDEPARHVELASVFGPAWRIERVDGVGHRGTLPGRHVVLDRSGAPTGVLVLSTDQRVFRTYVPDFIETRPSEVELRRALRRLSPLGRHACGVIGSCPP